MKREQLIREIRRAAAAHDLEFEVVREGAEHSIFRCGSVQTSIPRHRELSSGVEVAVRRDLEAVLGERWWRR